MPLTFATIARAMGKASYAIEDATDQLFCKCGHLRQVHRHNRHGSDCGKCGCPNFRIRLRPAARKH